MKEVIEKILTYLPRYFEEPGEDAANSRIPTARVASRSKKGGRNSQPVIHQGTSPATELGATAKKRAEPNTAIVFCTASPSRPVAMLMQPCPVCAFSGRIATALRKRLDQAHCPAHRASAQRDEGGNARTQG